MLLKRLTNWLLHAKQGAWEREFKKTGLLQSMRPSLLPVAVIAIQSLLIVFFGALLWKQSRSREDAQFQRGSLEHSEIRLRNEISKAPLARGLASSLPRLIDTNAVLTRVQRLAAQNSVFLIRLAPSKAVGQASAAGLSQHVWELQLSGNYPDVKDFLAQLLDQSPELWLSHLLLNGEGPSVQAKVSLQAWSIEQPVRSAHPGVTP